MKGFIITAACFLAVGGAFANTVIVGGQSGKIDYPFVGCWGINSVRSQGLVLPTDAVPAGTISKWEWYPYKGSRGSFFNFKLKCCHTNLKTLTKDFTANYGGNTPELVYSRSSQYIDGAPYNWFGFTFDTPFTYNGRDGLIIEVDWKDDTGGFAYSWADPVTGRFVFSANGLPPSVQAYLHYQRITIKPSSVAVAPTSLGRVKSLFN